MRIKAQKAIPGLIAFVLIAGTAFYLSRPRVIYGNPTGEIPLEMPTKLGGYTAERMLFCNSDQCSRAFRESTLRIETNGVVEVRTTCPVCDSDLAPISIGEKKLLPDNTPIFRREYIRDGSLPIQATIVFSGIERRSIHRPQTCLVSQGNRITNEYPYDVKTGPDSTLEITILELQQFYGEADGTKTSVSSIYAYWLFNPERETNSHLSRFLHMAIDNSLRNYRPRWGYVSISLLRDPKKPDAWKDQLNEFVPLLYPVLEEVREKLDAQRNIATVIQGRSAELNQYDGETGDVTENPYKKANRQKEDTEKAPTD